jgi:hypothetical protein
MSSELNQWLVHNLGKLFEQLQADSGTKIECSRANLQKMAFMIQEYLHQEYLLDGMEQYQMSVERYE